MSFDHAIIRTFPVETPDQEMDRIHRQVSGQYNSYKPAKARPQADEIWHVRLPGETALRTVKITETTANTVRFYDVNLPIGQGSNQRYEHSDVKFVERAK
jgi:hypothetical protein